MANFYIQFSNVSSMVGLVVVARELIGNRRGTGVKRWIVGFFLGGKGLGFLEGEGTEDLRSESCLVTRGFVAEKDGG
eukprot:715181-Amorphochlora_amoeboformis.AAC.1